MPGAAPAAAARLTTARNNARAASVAGKVYVFGGCSDAACTSLVPAGEVYNPGNDSWSAISLTGFTPRRNMAVGVINGKIYVAGGNDSAGQPVAPVEVYDPGSYTWASLALLDQLRAIFGVFAIMFAVKSRVSIAALG